MTYLTHLILSFGIAFILYPYCLKLILGNWFQNTFDRFETVLLAFGLAPLSISFLLYYIMLIAKGLPPIAYISIVIAIPVALNIFLKPKQQHPIVTLLTDFFRSISVVRERFRSKQGFIEKLISDPFAKLYTHVWFILILSLVVFFMITKPIVDHDVVIYGLLGNLFADNLAIEYQDHLVNPKSGFYYIGLHGFAFPLQRTFEVLITKSLSIKSDLYFRFVSGYYGLLILAFIAYWTRKRSWGLGFASSILAMGSLSFMFLFFVYHIDSMRVFALMLSIHLLIKLIRASQPSLKLLILFGWILGMTSFIHSINVILVAIIKLVWYWYSGRKLNISFPLVLLLAIMIGGGVHYLLDLTIGTGWLLRK